MPNCWCSFSLLLSLSLFCVIITAATPEGNDEERIFMSISAKHRRIAFSWYNIDSKNSTDVIVIAEKYPIEAFSLLVDLNTDQVSWVDNASEPVLFAKEISSPNGWSISDIHYSSIRPDTPNATEKCYPLWAYLINENGEVRKSSCLKTYANWMYSMRDRIGKHRLCDLFIVGTHDSAGYRDPSAFHPQNDTLVTKFALTQDEDVKSQLLFGARYLDIRIGYYYNNPIPFWANHGITRLHPLKDIFNQVKQFLDETNEIVILDVQEFPIGFKKNGIHQLLVQFIRDELEEYMVDPTLTWNASLDQIWKSGKRLIVSYDHVSTAQEFSSVIFPSVKQNWGNVQNIPDLKKYLIKVRTHLIPNYNGRPVADMAELTPDPWAIITKLKFFGLRSFADSSNPYISQWYFREFGPTTNIVAVDFLRSTDIAEAALYWNKKKFSS